MIRILQKIAFGLCFGPLVLHGQNFLNGSFESASVSVATQQTPDFWAGGFTETLAPNDDDKLSGTPFGTQFVLAPDNLCQTVTGFTPGTQYRLEMWLAQGSEEAVDLDVALGGAVWDLTLPPGNASGWTGLQNKNTTAYWGVQDSSLTSLSEQPDGVASWLMAEGFFTPSGSDVQFCFRSRTFGGGLDKLTLSVVPEPGMTALLVMSFGFGCRRVKRRKQL